MSISVDGIISGLDTSGLIADLVSAYSAPKVLLEEQVTDYEALQDALTGLSSRLSDLQNALEDLDSGDEIREYSVTYPETDAFIAEASGEAVEGVYSVEVNQLAKSELEASQNFADNSSTGVISEGTLTVTYAGTDTDITIDSTNSSLNELAAELNEVDGLSAYVINTGDETEPYRLVVQGTETGSDNSISFDTSGLTGAGTVPTFTEMVAAQDAELTINGIDITSDSNNVNDAIDGFSLTLTGVTTDAVDVTVSLDQDAVKDKIQTFVDAYNEIIDYVATNSVAADEDSGIEAGIFNGDSGVRRIVSALQMKVASEYGDLDSDLDSLGLIGVKLDNDGKLSIDDDTFEDVMDSDLDAILDMFTSEDGFGQVVVESLDVYIDPIDGTIKLRNDSIDDNIDNLEDQIERWETRILSYEERLRAQFVAFESAAGALQGTSNFLASYFAAE